MKNLFFISFIAFVLLTSCSSKSDRTQVGENTFLYKSKVYRIVDNEVLELCDLDNSKIRKFEVLKPKMRDLGTRTFDYVKEGATTNINTLYRGHSLYFTLELDNINDLKEAYTPGELIINFMDEYGFILNSTVIQSSDLIGLVNERKEVQKFQYNGKTEMSTDINSAISSFTVSSTIRKRQSVYDY